MINRSGYIRCPILPRDNLLYVRSRISTRIRAVRLSSRNDVRKSSEVSRSRRGVGGRNTLTGARSKINSWPRHAASDGGIHSAPLISRDRERASRRRSEEAIEKPRERAILWPRARKVLWSFATRVVFLGGAPHVPSGSFAHPLPTFC